MERLSILDVDMVVNSTAYAVRGRYKNFVEFEDLVSEGWLWISEHPEQIDEYMSFERPPLAAWWLGRDVWKRMDRYARRQRAASLGYQPEDEAFYGPGVVANMLPHVLSGVPDQPVTEKTGNSNSGDPAHGGDWLVMYLDVKQAWYSTPLSDRERSVLMAVYLDGLSQGSVADLMDIDIKTVGRCLTRGIGKLSEALGGQRPGECPYTCECHEGRLRRRP